MRKYLATLVFGGCALMGTPLVAASPVDTPDASPSAVIHQVPARVSVPGYRDEAAMLLVGAALIGLGAALRRAA